MAAARDVTGGDGVIRNIRRADRQITDNVKDAVGKASVLVANHAKSDHTEGFAHTVKRYANQTTNLTNSILPEEVRIVAGEVRGGVTAHRDYAIPVELGTAHSRAYPFMFPAMVANEENFRLLMKGALR